MEFIQDPYQVLPSELKIQLQNSSSTEVNERTAQVTGLMEMGGKYEGPPSGPERLSGCTSGEIMSRRREMSVLCTLGSTRHSRAFLSWSMSRVGRAA